jgi:hypothetical protein
MQEVRGSTPLSSTFPQVKCLLRSSKLALSACNPASCKRLQALVQVEADADQTPAAPRGTGWVTAFALGQPNWQPFGDPSGSCPSGFDLFGAACLATSVNLKDLHIRSSARQIADSVPANSRADGPCAAHRTSSSGWRCRRRCARIARMCGQSTIGVTIAVGETLLQSLRGCGRSWSPIP